MQIHNNEKLINKIQNWCVHIWCLNACAHSYTHMFSLSFLILRYHINTHHPLKSASIIYLVDSNKHTNHNKLFTILYHKVRYWDSRKSKEKESRNELVHWRYWCGYKRVQNEKVNIHGAYFWWVWLHLPPPPPHLDIIDYILKSQLLRMMICGRMRKSMKYAMRIASPLSCNRISKLSLNSNKSVCQ